MPTALAIFAHPDDIEFVAAGTLLLLKQAGWEIHYLNLSSGNLGSAKMARAVGMGSVEAQKTKEHGQRESQIPGPTLQIQGCNVADTTRSWTPARSSTALKPNSFAAPCTVPQSGRATSVALSSDEADESALPDCGCASREAGGAAAFERARRAARLSLPP
jgi:hypothetical protein